MLPEVPQEYIDLLGNLDQFETVFELGNKRNKGIPYSLWYESRGLKYKCLDWNGLDNAVKFDIQKPLDVDSIDGPFDVVTNWGFTEHVAKQEPCWDNIHKLIKVGGAFCSATPTPPNWDRHGFWQPNETWFEELAELNNYKITHLSTDNWHGSRDGSRKEVRIRFIKQSDTDFVFPTATLYRTPKGFHEEPQYA